MEVGEPTPERAFRLTRPRPTGRTNGVAIEVDTLRNVAGLLALVSVGVRAADKIDFRRDVPAAYWWDTITPEPDGVTYSAPVPANSVQPDAGRR